MAAACRAVFSCNTLEIEKQRRTGEIRVYGDRPEVTFKEAVEKFLREDCPTKSLERAGYAFDNVLLYIGEHKIERGCAAMNRPRSTGDSIATPMSKCITTSIY